MGAAAAKGNEAVALFGSVHAKGFSHVFIRGVGHGFVINRILHLGGIKDIRNLLENTGFDNALVSNDQRFFATDALQTGGNLFRTSLAHKRNIGDEERSDLPHMHAFKIRAHT